MRQGVTRPGGRPRSLGHVFRRWLVLVALGVAAFVGAGVVLSVATQHPATRSITQPGPLVVVSVPELTWSEVSASRTPTLWHLATTGAVAAQQTRILSGHSCSNQAWMTISAGRKTAVGPEFAQTPPGGTPGDCPRPLKFARGPGDTVVYPRYDEWREITLDRAPPADIGRLADKLAADGQCLTASGAYAPLGAANRRGIVAHYTPSPADVDLTRCPVTFVGFDGLHPRALADLVDRLPEDATIVVTGMADDSAPEVLRTAVVNGPGVPHGVLTSPASRQPGFIETTDVAALVFGRLGTVGPSAAGSPVVRPVTSPTAPIEKVRALARTLEVEHPFVPWFFGLFLGGAVLALSAGAVWWGVARRRQDARGEARRVPRGLRTCFAGVGAACAATPVSTFLVGAVPWWRSAHPRVALALGVAAIAAGLAALALLGPWRRRREGPMMFLAAVTAVVIAQDVVHGSRLQFTSMMGLQPVYGGRFFGQGNVGYALYATCALLVAAVLAGRVAEAGHRRLAAATVAVVGTAAVLVDGYPWWGADAGGSLAMVPAFALLALSAAGLRLTWRRALVIGVGAVAVVAAFATIDFLRPASSRTHVGQLVANVVQDGQVSELTRVWTVNWAVLTSSWLSASASLLLVVTLLLLVVPHRLIRPLRPVLDRVRLLERGLTAVAVCWLLAFLLNDSGTAIPPTGLLIAIPLLLVLAAHRPPAGRGPVVGEDAARGRASDPVGVRGGGETARTWE